MRNLQVITLRPTRGRVDISGIRELRTLIGKEIDFLFLPGNSQLIGKNKRAAHPAGIFLDKEVSESAKEQQVVTFYPQGVSAHGVTKEAQTIQCDAQGQIVLPVTILRIIQDTNIQVTSFLLQDPSLHEYVGFAMLSSFSREID